MKNEELVATRLPKQLLRDLQAIEQIEHSDRSSVLRRLLDRAIRDWKLQHQAEQYARGRVSLSRAAREAGVSVREMADHIRARKIAMQYDIADLEQDLRNLYKRLPA